MRRENERLLQHGESALGRYEYVQVRDRRVHRVLMLSLLEYGYDEEVNSDREEMLDSRSHHSASLLCYQVKDLRTLKKGLSYEEATEAG